MTFEEWWGNARVSVESGVGNEKLAAMAAWQASREAALEEAMQEVRSQCGACNGTGIASSGYTEYVTHDMAIDAGEPALEGQVYAHHDATECEYCGRPISAIRALKHKEG